MEIQVTIGTDGTSAVLAVSTIEDLWHDYQYFCDAASAASGTFHTCRSVFYLFRRTIYTASVRLRSCEAIRISFGDPNFHSPTASSRAKNFGMKWNETAFQVVCKLLKTRWPGTELVPLSALTPCKLLFLRRARYARRASSANLWHTFGTLRVSG